MKRKTGRVTLPSEENFLKETKELMERWGADAIRDSDGTKLDNDIKQLMRKFIRLILLLELTMSSQRSIWMNASNFI